MPTHCSLCSKERLISTNIVLLVLHIEEVRIGLTLLTGKPTDKSGGNFALEFRARYSTLSVWPLPT